MGPGDLCRHFGELGRSEHKGEESSRRVAVYIVRYIDFELPFIYPSPYHPINMGDRTSLKFIVTLGKWRMNLLDWFGVTFEAKNLTSVQLICGNVMNRT